MQQEFDRRQEEEANQNPTPTYKSDADRIIHRHLKDKNDVITDEDLRNIRVGSGPVEMDGATLARFGEDSEADDLERKIEQEPNSGEASNNAPSGGNPITPWDLEKE